ncbi:MAG: aminomethyl-transferring glycine dehydrogenase subunit GcvPA [Bacteroidaceae bacterium]|nr:aminomethyl-transferring glycine dehydrogenase subunit GcvPA [Bacteroidaceae bacterium]
MNQYIPHTEEDIRQMLEKIGMKSLDELYSDVPSDFLYQGEYDLPDAKSEEEIRRYFKEMASRTTPLVPFVGQGWYDHYTPSVIAAIASRSEFFTAYTPYQPEISQGTLRYIFEYQSMICELTGMEVSNASMYDGPTAAAEASRLAITSARKKDTMLISSTLLPQVKKVVKTYARYAGTVVVEIAEKDGQTSLEALREALATHAVAGVIVPTTNKYGIIEDHSGFADAIHEAKALLIEYCDPSTLAVLKSPAENGADVAVGDGQSLGIPLSFGGPSLGFMACSKEHMRKLPGRIVGATVDKEGKRCFVLTLQAREQHIRRDKATSNICSNESLMALWVTIYLSIMGTEGLKEVNEKSFAGAHYLYDRLLATGKFTKLFDKPFLKEFAVCVAQGVDIRKLQKKLVENGLFAAQPIGDGIVTFCVTEKRTREEIDKLIQIIREEA